MNLTGRLIVIIETDPHIAHFLTTILSKNGAAVHSGPWTVDMLTFIQHNQHQIYTILMNMRHLHNKTGFDVYDELHEHLSRHDIPVIAISGMSRHEAPHIRAAGFAGFIAKPISPAKLTNQISRILEQHRNLHL